MNYPLISEYIDAIRSAESNFKQLSNLRPVLDDSGNPVMSSGNFAVVFKMEDCESGKLYAVKCFTREQEKREERYQEIVKTLKTFHSRHLVSTQYLDKELFVDTTQSDETEYPVVVMDWVEGVYLNEYLRNIERDKFKRELLANEFQKFVCWLLPKPFAHGDLKPDNIIIKEDGSMVLVDYDGMFVPSLYGKPALETGTPKFQYKGRTLSDFNEYIDDYAAVLLLLILKVNAISAVNFEDYLIDDNTAFIRKFERYLNEKSVAPLLSAYIIVSTFGRIDRQQIYCLIADNADFDPKKETELLYAARKGDTVAMINLGDLYSRGVYVPQNNSKAIQWYELAQRLGNVNAICRLCKCYSHGEDFGFTPKNSALLDSLEKHKINFAYCRKGEDYYFGLGIERNPENAVARWRKATEVDNPCALRWLGNCYKYGHGVSKDIDKAISLLIKAAEAGDASSQYILGGYYVKGEGVKKDLEKAVYWYTKAAEAGDSDAQYILGNLYANGKGVEIDSNKALYWYTKAAEAGNSKSQYILGNLYTNGLGVVEIDSNKAVYWYTKAAEAGDSDAQYILGNFYEKGTGVEKDVNKAIYWLQKAAQKGHPYAQYGLGVFGRLVGKDLNKALYWFQKAADNGNATAQCMLGECYYEDNGKVKDLNKATFWFQKAADQGNANAQNSLGVCYYRGDGVEQDFNKAVDWFKKSAAKGNTIAQKNLGVCHYRGDGIEQDFNKAIFWFQKAADQGNANAQYELGYCYYYGKGIEKNVDKAVEWFKKSLLNKNENLLCNTN